MPGYILMTYLGISSVQLLSRVQLFTTPWIVAHQAFLSFTISQSLLELMSIESVMQSNHLILCHPLLLLVQSVPESGSFQMSQFCASGGQSIRVSASGSVLSMNIQDWFPSAETNAWPPPTGLVEKWRLAFGKDKGPRYSSQVIWKLLLMATHCSILAWRIPWREEPGGL